MKQPQYNDQTSEDSGTDQSQTRQVVSLLFFSN